jgi:hypothetical protein
MSDAFWGALLGSLTTIVVVYLQQRTLATAVKQKTEQEAIAVKKALEIETKKVRDALVTQVNVVKEAVAVSAETVKAKLETQDKIKNEKLDTLAENVEAVHKVASVVADKLTGVTPPHK